MCDSNQALSIEDQSQLKTNIGNEAQSKGIFSSSLSVTQYVCWGLLFLPATFVAVVGNYLFKTLGDQGYDALPGAKLDPIGPFLAPTSGYIGCAVRVIISIYTLQTSLIYARENYQSYRFLKQYSPQRSIVGRLVWRYAVATFASVTTALMMYLLARHAIDDKNKGSPLTWQQHVEAISSGALNGIQTFYSGYSIAQLMQSVLCLKVRMPKRPTRQLKGGQEVEGFLTGTPVTRPYNNLQYAAYLTLLAVMHAGAQFFSAASLVSFYLSTVNSIASLGQNNKSLTFLATPVAKYTIGTLLYSFSAFLFAKFTFDCVQKVLTPQRGQKTSLFLRVPGWLLKTAAVGMAYIACAGMLQINRDEGLEQDWFKYCCCIGATVSLYFAQGELIDSVKSTINQRIFLSSEQRQAQHKDAVTHRFFDFIGG